MLLMHSAPVWYYCAAVALCTIRVALSVHVKELQYLKDFYHANISTFFSTIISTIAILATNLLAVSIYLENKFS
jgi:hypothetical protein